ncbi:hypothetical protein XELAEV_18019742mg [Xenopus laevis]|uniref:Uncharacterized protein n=1 Tax=Xenopus laevis TaxID=8355 RepID=A0A974D5K1_XENLA|nr:hypothetical protein XELAEV_18019742mg [Xenopus laevis]
MSPSVTLSVCVPRTPTPLTNLSSENLQYTHLAQTVSLSVNISPLALTRCYLQHCLFCSTISVNASRTLYTLSVNLWHTLPPVHSPTW